MIAVFSVALAPYRIDFFNSIAEMGDASFYFTQQGVDGSSFDEDQMQQECRFLPRILKSISLLGRRLPLSVWGILWKEKPKTVFVPEFSLVTLLVLLFRILFFAKFKVISICDDSINMLNGNDFSHMHGYARRLMAPLCDNLVLLDKKSVDWYQKRYGKGLWFPMIRNEEKYTLQLSNAQNAEQGIRSLYPVVNAYKVVLFVGRLIALKNVDSIIRALPDDAFLVVVGDGEERQKLEQLAAQMKKQVLFVGWKNGDELLAWYRIAHVLVLASFREAFGAVVNEALLAGCHVCVSERAGSACLVSQENGVVFKPENLEELRIKIKEVIDLSSADKKVISLMDVTYSEYIKQVEKLIYG